MRWIVLALLGALWVSPAGASPPDACEVPDYLKHSDGQLARVAETVAKDRRLDILVVGTGSSALAGTGAAAYPARLQAMLASRLPGVAVTVRTEVKSRRTAADMVKTLERNVLDSKPNLVIWQTGTVDAMRGVDPEEFRATLEDGIKKLHAAGIDVLLINMQYSPRTESMIAAGTYAENMRWVSQQHEVPLFDRLAVMRHWSEGGLFDLSHAPGNSQLAEKVHDCIGTLLAELIIDAAHLNQAQDQSKPKDPQ